MTGRSRSPRGDGGEDAMPRWIDRAAAACCLSLALVSAPVTSSAHGAEIKVISSTAMREALEAVAPLFEQASGHTVALRFESGAVLPGVVRADTPADLIVTTPDVIAQLGRGG